MTNFNLSSSPSSVKIEYELIKEDEGRYKRFAAFINTSDGGNAEKKKMPLSIIDWAQIFSSYDGDNFRDDFTSLINQHTKQQPSSSLYQAYFFETKGATFQNADKKQFEFVLVHSDGLNNFCERSGPTPDAFADKFRSNCPSDVAESTCCSFPNLGHTATLIAPKPQHNSDYCHIGKFLRNASTKEVRQLWKMVGSEYLNQLRVKEDRSLWLSTSGLGVSWLHFRIDLVPKYYTFHEFANES